MFKDVKLRTMTEYFKSLWRNYSRLSALEIISKRKSCANPDSNRNCIKICKSVKNLKILKYACVVLAILFVDSSASKHSVNALGCTNDEFYDNNLEACRPCSACRKPRITLMPCYEYQDTMCGRPEDHIELRFTNDILSGRASGGGRNKLKNNNRKKQRKKNRKRNSRNMSANKPIARSGSEWYHINRIESNEFGSLHEEAVKFYQTSESPLTTVAIAKAPESQKSVQSQAGIDVATEAGVHAIGYPGYYNNSFFTHSDYDHVALPPPDTPPHSAAAADLLSSGWTAALVLCALLLVAICVLALLLTLLTQTSYCSSSKILGLFRSRDTEVAASSSDVLMKTMDDQKPRDLEKGLGRVPNKVHIARTYRPDKMNTSNSNASILSNNASILHSNASILSNNGSVLHSNGSVVNGSMRCNGSPYRDKTVTLLDDKASSAGGIVQGCTKEIVDVHSKTMPNRSKNRRREKETSVCVHKKVFAMTKDDILDGNTPLNVPLLHDSSPRGFRSSSHRYRAQFTNSCEPTAHEQQRVHEQLFPATTSTFVNSSNVQNSPFGISSNVENSTFVNSSNVQNFSNHEKAPTTSPQPHTVNNLSYTSQTLPTTYVRRSPVSTTANISSTENSSPILSIFSSGSSETKGSPIPYTMDKLLEERRSRRVGDANLYVEMWSDGDKTRH